MRAIGIQYANSHFHYVVLSVSGEVMSCGIVPANRDELRRAFRAFEPTCIAMDGTSSMSWAVDLLAGMDHAVHVDSRLLLGGAAGDGGSAYAYSADCIDSNAAVLKAERFARNLREQWTRGIAAMRAAATETAVYV